MPSAFRPDPRGSYSRSPLDRPLALAKGRHVAQGVRALVVPEVKRMKARFNP